MTPRHFWWLVETLNPPKAVVSFSDEARADILGWLKGNETGAF
jgi:hypothetical protein